MRYPTQSSKAVTQSLQAERGGPSSKGLRTVLSSDCPWVQLPRTLVVSDSRKEEPRWGRGSFYFRFRSLPKVLVRPPRLDLLTHLSIADAVEYK